MEMFEVKWHPVVRRWISCGWVNNRGKDFDVERLGTCNDSGHKTTWKSVFCEVFFFFFKERKKSFF